MKKTLLSLILLSIGLTLPAQIKIAKQASKKIDYHIKYDSLHNYLGDKIYQYIGQELYVKPKVEELQRFGYEDFYNSMAKKDIYKKPTNTAWYSSYESLQGRTFKVIDILKREIVMGEDMPLILGDLDSDYIYYLKIADKQDTIYYKYTKYEHNFPFLVIGYLDKMKNLYSNKTFLMKKTPDDSVSDFENGGTVQLTPNSKWFFKDAVLDGKYLKDILLIFTNDKGETVSTEDYRIHFMFIEKTVADKIKSKYGVDMYNAAMNGKIKIGMSKELVKLAWGEPSDINRADYGEQWVYDNQYIYFKNGKVTGFN
ncbi:hypothetical protein [Bacteroides cellulosilyticus]|uniref:hypothetical protein n=1 Tax=Bacteroides cellulosilyticus TaxID=246787 RepID=UPI0032BF78C5